MTDRLEVLDRGTREFRDRLVSVRADQWGLPTPCSEWDVRALVVHVVGESEGIARMFDSYERTEREMTDDFVAEWDGITTTIHDLFAASIFSGGIVHHPAFGDQPAETFISARIAGVAVHTWDLARAIGASEDFDPGVLETALSYYGRRVGAPGNARMAAGPASLPTDATLLEKVLLCAGRTP